MSTSTDHHDGGIPTIDPDTNNPLVSPSHTHTRNNHLVNHNSSLHSSNHNNQIMSHDTFTHYNHNGLCPNNHHIPPDQTSTTTVIDWDCENTQNTAVDGGDDEGRIDRPTKVEIIRAPQKSSRRCLVPKLRYVLVVLGLLGCTVDYLVRYGLSVAIVAMVNNTRTSSIPSNLQSTCPASNASSPDNDVGYDGDFSWSLREQGVILGTFFWGYFITKSSGGRISEIFGARETMAVSLGGSGLLCLLCPAAASLHPMALATVRLIMGLMQGPAFPALYSVLTRWAPPDELATMVTVSYSGMSVGSLIALGGSGWVVSKWGWRWVFWGGGILAVIWMPLWLYFVRNFPEEHPFISSKERELLRVNFHIRPRRQVPWRRLLKCWRFYPSIVAEMATSWISNLTTTEAPTFLREQIGVEMSEVCWVLSATQASHWMTSFTCGRMADLFVRNNYLSKRNTRRLIHSIGTTLIVVGAVTLAGAGCQLWLVSSMMIMIMMGCATTLSTFMLTPVDIAPNYAGTLSGLLGLGNISGFIAPIATAQLVTWTGGWSSSFVLGGSIYLAAGILYVTTVTSEVQEWNDYEELPGSSSDEHNS